MARILRLRLQILRAIRAVISSVMAYKIKVKCLSLLGSGLRVIYNFQSALAVLAQAVRAWRESRSKVNCNLGVKRANGGL